MTIESVSHKKNYFIAFRFSLFFEFFCYHFLYCCLLGPLSIPIIALINNRSMILPRNLQFWGFKSASITQNINYLMSYFGVFVFYYFRPKNIFFYGEILMIFMTMVIRIMCNF